MLFQFVTITPNAKLDLFQCNAYSYAAHDCVSDDHVTFGPSARYTGNVLIEDNVYFY